MAPPPTGQQWSLRHGTDELTVVEVGGGLRSWTRGGLDVLAGYGADERLTMGRGQLLMPWPNRVADGRYRFGKRDHQLALTEPARHNAIHGLVRWAAWSLLEQAPDSVTVGLVLRPQPGWAWTLECTTRYAVGADGLTVTSSATNLSDDPAPFGYGVHPYLAIGDAPWSDVQLTIPAATWVETDDRLLPVARRAVAGTDRDLRTPRPVGTDLDTAFTDLTVDGDGRWRVGLAAPGRPRTALWAEAARFPWLQVFTGSETDDPDGPRGVAVEPMTCPAGALVTGDSLLVLGPGEGWTGTWGIDVAAPGR
ncbi:MAG TPA: aldose 1-epimerase family protein [Dermatophilaceae bacterium]|nr:aldose 1-epimerase family protein [Dermatophilaceae bacterium]